jgi:hypothetical protein
MKIAPLRLAYALPLVSFIVNKGDVNKLAYDMFGLLFNWPPYSQEGYQARLTIQGPLISHSNDLGREDRCAFWRSLAGLIPY